MQSLEGIKLQLGVTNVIILPELLHLLASLEINEWHNLYDWDNAVPEYFSFIFHLFFIL